MQEISRIAGKRNHSNEIIAFVFLANKNAYCGDISNQLSGISIQVTQAVIG